MSIPGDLRRLAALAAAAIVAGLAVAGCGGSAEPVDRGGFTSDDRKAAEKALAVLGETAVWTTAAKATYTQGFPPTRCVVHIKGRDPLTFDVLMTWVPEQRNVNRTFSWLQAVIGPDGVDGDYSFDYGNEVSRAALESHYGDRVLEARAEVHRADQPEVRAAPGLRAQPAAAPAS